MLTVYCKKIIIKLSNDKGMNIMNIAILYHVKEPPQVGNIRKPMKEGGYSDSDSDLAYELNKNGYNLPLDAFSVERCAAAIARQI